MVAAVCAVVAYQGAVAEEEQVGVRVEEGAARVAAEAVDVPSVASCARLAGAAVVVGVDVEVEGSRRGGPRLPCRGGEEHTKFECFSFLEDLRAAVSASREACMCVQEGGRALPLRIPCTDRQSRPRLGTLDRLLDYPWWRRARVGERGKRALGCLAARAREGS